MLPPRRNESNAALEALRPDILAHCCVAGLGGLPQVNLPAASVDGVPVGLSIIAAREHDRLLLDLAQAFAAR